MIGLIFKLWAMFLVVVFGILIGLNVAGVIEPGTIAVEQPNVEPCRRATAALDPLYVEVRWVWHAHAYGWGCFYELDDGSTHTIAPMPR